MLSEGIIYAFLASVFWSLASVFYGRGMNRNFNILLSNAFRTPLALLVLFVYTVYAGYWPSGYLELFGSFWFVMGILVATIIMNVVGDSFYLLAIESIGVARAFPLSYTYPLLVAVLSFVFLGENVGVLVLLGIIVSLVGIKIMAEHAGGESEFMMGRSRVGYLFALGASLSWSGGIIIYKVLTATLKPPVIATVKLLFLTLIATSASINSFRNLKSLDWKDKAAYLSIGGLFGLGLGDLSFYFSLQSISASVASAITTSSPFISQILAVVFLGEKISVRVILGTILIVLGILIVISASNGSY